MSVIKTLKHEMSYDSETKRAIFNNRNMTANLPQNDAFPERLIVTDESSGGGEEIEDNTLITSPSDEISNTTLEMSSPEIEEHTLII